MTGWLALLMALLFAVAAPAAAQTFPQLTGRVVDQAHLLTAAQVADLTSKSEALQAQSGRQFVVATVNNLEGREIEDYAYRLGRYWKIGSTKENDGVVLLVAPNEHKVWIATGYGAGGFLTDAMAGVITREAILPRFKAGDMGGGIEAGADAIIKQMSVSPEEAQKNVAAAEQAQKQRQHSGGNPLPVIFWFLVIGFVILSHFRRGAGQRYRTRGGGISPWVMLWGLNALSNSGRRGGGWGGGSSWGGGGGGSGWGGGGGGFGGFSGGGGSFGGGGAGGSW
ncbi:MAG: TPM domain-containing protein [Sphingomicrobium sp.]